VTRYCSEGQWTTKVASDQLSDSNKLTIKWIACAIVVATLVIVPVVVFVVRCWHTGGKGGGGGGAGGNNNDVCEIDGNTKALLHQSALELPKGDAARKGILKVINGRLSKKECYKRIFFIIDSLPKNSSVIERLLLEHITQCHLDGNPSLDGAYACATATASDTATAGPPPSAPSPQPSDDDEPIYQEPDQQRPLMCSDYSSPLHPVEDTYSEPFNATSKLGSAYRDGSMDLSLIRPLLPHPNRMP